MKTLINTFNNLRQTERLVKESSLDILSIICIQLAEQDKIDRNVSIPNNFHSNGTNIIEVCSSVDGSHVNFIDINNL